MREGRPQAVDFFFARDEPSAHALVADLGGQGLSAEAHSNRTGWLRRRVAWSVNGTALLDSVHLHALDDLVNLLQRTANRHDADFEGWGAEIGQ